MAFPCVGRRSGICKPECRYGHRLLNAAWRAELAKPVAEKQKQVGALDVCIPGCARAPAGGARHGRVL